VGNWVFGYALIACHGVLAGRVIFKRYCIVMGLA